MKRLHLTLPEPCHENWTEMTPNEKGRFCAACQKNVYDFTKSTDREIINAYEKDKNLCGRFLNTQLDRELMIPNERKSIWLASLFFGMISLWNTKTSAQEEPKTEQTDIKTKDSEKSVIEAETQSEVKTITGMVSDATGPIPGANVIVKGTTRSAQTDFYGKYTILAQQGEVLVFSFMGMYNLTKTVGYSNIMNVALKDNTDELKSILIGSVSEGRFNRSVEIWK